MRGHNDPDPKWDAVDWSLTNREIARELGVSHQRIAQVRFRRGEQPSSGSHDTRRKRRVVEMAKTLPVSEIARRLGVSRQAVYSLLARAGVKAVNARGGSRPDAWKYPWDDVDWVGKYDSQIARELGCAGPVVSQARKRLGKPAGPDGRRVGRGWESRMPLEAVTDRAGPRAESSEGWSTGRLLSEALRRYGRASNGA